MKPLSHLPDDYKLMTVFDLIKDKRAKNSMLTVVIILFSIMACFWIAHLIITLTRDPNIPLYALWIWIIGLILSPILAIGTLFILTRWVHIRLTGKKPIVNYDGWYLYYSNTEYYFSRNQCLQILLLPQGIISLTILILILFVPAYITSILLFTISIALACSVADFLLASYIWRLPNNTIIHQDRSRFEIYRHKKIALPTHDGLIIKKEDVADTAVFPKPAPQDTLIDETKLKEKEIAKFDVAKK